MNMRINTSISTSANSPKSLIHTSNIHRRGRNKGIMRYKTGEHKHNSMNPSPDHPMGERHKIRSSLERNCKEIFNQEWKILGLTESFKTQISKNIRHSGAFKQHPKHHKVTLFEGGQPALPTKNILNTYGLASDRSQSVRTAQNNIYKHKRKNSGVRFEGLKIEDRKLRRLEQILNDEVGIGKLQGNQNNINNNNNNTYIPPKPHNTNTQYDLEKMVGFMFNMKFPPNPKLLEHEVQKTLDRHNQRMGVVPKDSYIQQLVQETVKRRMRKTREAQKEAEGVKRQMAVDVLASRRAKRKCFDAGADVTRHTHTHTQTTPGAHIVKDLNDPLDVELLAADYEQKDRYPTYKNYNMSTEEVSPTGLSTSVDRGTQLTSAQYSPKYDILNSVGSRNRHICTKPHYRTYFESFHESKYGSPLPFKHTPNRNNSRLLSKVNRLFNNIIEDKGNSPDMSNRSNINTKDLNHSDIPLSNKFMYIYIVRPDC